MLGYGYEQPWDLWRFELIDRAVNFDLNHASKTFVLKRLLNISAWVEELEKLLLSAINSFLPDFQLRKQILRANSFYPKRLQLWILWAFSVRNFFSFAELSNFSFNHDLSINKAVSVPFWCPYRDKFNWYRPLVSLNAIKFVKLFFTPTAFSTKN